MLDSPKPWIQWNALTLEKCRFDLTQVDLGARMRDGLIHFAGCEGDVGSIVRAGPLRFRKLPAREDVVTIDIVLQQDGLASPEVDYVESTRCGCALSVA